MNCHYLLAAAAVAIAPAAALATPAGPTIAAIPGVKNIIMIVIDGGGPTVYDAVRLYNGVPLTTDGAGFASTFVSTYPLRSDGTVNGVNNNTPGTLAQAPNVVYNSAKFWDTTPVAGLSTAAGYNTPAFAQAGFASVPGPLYPAAFAGYEFSRFAHPDSGNTATALASGIKTYNNAINVDGAGVPSIAIPDVIAAAASVGKATGVVTTVEFADATPAALGGAHNIARANRNAIAVEMFAAGHLSVIGGSGNPDFDDNGALRATPNYQWMPAPLWADLKNNTNTSGGNAQHWTLLQTRAAIQNVANKVGKPPAKLAMIYRSFTSSNFNRTNTVTINGNPIDATQDTVNGTPRRTDVPTQSELTRAALNALDAKGRGFFLMSEAGAVDRAEHANDTARMIEEMNEAEQAIADVMTWIDRTDTAATRENTLVIVTADHDHLLYGPNGDTIPFQPLVDKGPGVVPGNKWFGPNHGTGLVPLYAIGAGAQTLVGLATHVDSYTDGQGRSFGHGRYVDQAELGQVLKLTAAQRGY